MKPVIRWYAAPRPPHRRRGLERTTSAEQEARDRQVQRAAVKLMRSLGARLDPQRAERDHAVQRIDAHRKLMLQPLHRAGRNERHEEQQDEQERTPSVIQRFRTLSAVSATAARRVRCCGARCTAGQRSLLRADVK